MAHTPPANADDGPTPESPAEAVAPSPDSPASSESLESPGSLGSPESSKSPESPESSQPPPAQPLEVAQKLPTGPGLAVTFLYYFVGSVLVANLLARNSSAYGLTTSIPKELALLVAALGGLLGAYFNHSTTLEIPIPSPKAFLCLLEATLTPLGYELESDIDGIRTYRRPALQQLLSGKIYVEVQPKLAILSSRASQLRRLRPLLVKKKMDSSRGEKKRGK